MIRGTFWRYLQKILSSSWKDTGIRSSAGVPILRPTTSRIAGMLLGAKFSKREVDVSNILLSLEMPGQ